MYTHYHNGFVHTTYAKNAKMKLISNFKPIVTNSRLQILNQTFVRFFKIYVHATIVTNSEGKKAWTTMASYSAKKRQNVA